MIKIVLLISLSLAIVKGKRDMESLLLNHLGNISYDPSELPSTNDPVDSKKSDQSTKIKVRMVINEIGSLSESQNEFTIGVTLNQMWTDTRLVLNQSFDFLSITDLKSKIWTPDLYFRNKKFISGNSLAERLLWLYPNGSVSFSTTQRLMLYCRIVLWRFPLDAQTCQMQLNSFRYPTEDLKLNWWYSTDDITKNIQLNHMYNNEFQYPTYKIEKNDSTIFAHGRFSILKVTFIFKRNFNYHVIYTFLPSALIVCVSWISFYIDYRAAPARVPFGLLTTLMLMAQWSSINAKLQRLSSLKCIDIWMLICLTFVIFSLIEYGAVSHFAIKREREAKKKSKIPKLETQNVSQPKRAVSHDSPLKFNGGFLTHLKRRNQNLDAIVSERTIQMETRKKLLQPYDIDRFSRYAFPLCFSVVNIIFWCMVMYYD